MFIDNKMAQKEDSMETSAMATDMEEEDADVVQTTWLKFVSPDTLKASFLISSF